MKQEEITGLIVMVSPVLWTSDHVGQIGIIELADFEKDKIWVGFEDEEVDAFSPKTLFILRATEELNELAETYKSVQWPPVAKNLQTLALLQASGSAEQLKKAFILLQDDPELHRVAIIRLNEALDLTPARKIGR
ncbi:hypothetical protein DIU31_022930 [Mucilaginibacter rubeus]|uniref:Uncharacterized protein n=2 Tax=Mucilaginibacter rubeus TaxID=2027860 RepID=A0A364WQI4_9SPHI|nr:MULTISPECIES: hypothetical protein [Mucilaginibacter]QEM06233.1 hypothetical protein DIU31_022930 [Mucilaginibacter rubeus]QEM13750.1 hypothetical protein DEO27_028285 [Mucilaginibacter rubeus]QEM18816.1 hypothetical protein DIU38_023170 [Mucilaginibacter gossypii]QTE36189.1 hypothetical protein J3L18_24125 [Mucilaginibacter gossypii]QTE44642.1 hypothetical protein J3L19_04550 [Mucilaginibacter rubeus]